jgi:hypothetical protein
VHVRKGRLISAQLQKWWLPPLCNSLGKVLEVSVSRGRLRRRGAVNVVVSRSHDRHVLLFASSGLMGQMASDLSRHALASMMLGCHSRGGMTRSCCRCRTLGAPIGSTSVMGPWLAHGLLEGQEARWHGLQAIKDRPDGLLGKLDLVIE